jgi:hypothetical protein
MIIGLLQIHVAIGDINRLANFIFTRQLSVIYFVLGGSNVDRNRYNFRFVGLHVARRCVDEGFDIKAIGARIGNHETKWTG